MEKALQDCCRSMRIGKILIDSDPDSQEAQVVFAKFVEDIAKRKVQAATISLVPKPKSANQNQNIAKRKVSANQTKTCFQVLLLYPIVSSGSKVCKAVQVLKEHQVFSEISVEF